MLFTARLEEVVDDFPRETGRIRRPALLGAAFAAQVGVSDLRDRVFLAQHLGVPAVPGGSPADVAFFEESLLSRGFSIREGTAGRRLLHLAGRRLVGFGLRMGRLFFFLAFFLRNCLVFI